MTPEGYPFSHACASFHHQIISVFVSEMADIFQLFVRHLVNVVLINGVEEAHSPDCKPDNNGGSCAGNDDKDCFAFADLHIALMDGFWMSLFE